MRRMYALAMVFLFTGCATVQGRFIAWPLGSNNPIVFQCQNADEVGKICCEATYQRCDITVCKPDEGEYSVENLECDY